ncbi:aldehyde dehydrogenase family protein, partial [Arthrospira platensis SPKY1]|nr:aldehyde dehydrogenase family protein [Arthrospira platensis SPKY1]
MQLNDPALLCAQACIDGQWLAADDGATFDVTNPADGSRIGSVPDMGAAETRRAIAAADAALPAWRARTAKERAAILRRWYELILANQEDLAVLMSTEQG